MPCRAHYTQVSALKANGESRLISTPVWVLLITTNTYMPGRYWLVATSCAFFAISSTASAVLVDWSTLTWPNGSTTQSSMHSGERRDGHRLVFVDYSCLRVVTSMSEPTKRTALPLSVAHDESAFEKMQTISVRPTETHQNRDFRNERGRLRPGRRRLRSICERRRPIIDFLPEGAWLVSPWSEIRGRARCRRSRSA